MNKTTQYIFALVLIFWLCAACAFMKGTYLPSVGYLNMSDDRIFNIELEWGGVKFLPIGGQIGSFGSGSYTSQSQWIQHTREAYGTAVLTWENAKHEKFRAEIEITKENFPNIGKKGASEDIKFEFRQDGMVYYTYQYPHAQERWRMIQKIQDALGFRRIYKKMREDGTLTEAHKQREKANNEKLANLRAEYEKQYLADSVKYADKQH